MIISDFSYLVLIRKLIFINFLRIEEAIKGQYQINHKSGEVNLQVVSIGYDKSMKTQEPNTITNKNQTKPE